MFSICLPFLNLARSLGCVSHLQMQILWNLLLIYKNAPNCRIIIFVRQSKLVFLTCQWVMPGFETSTSEFKTDPSTIDWAITPLWIIIIIVNHPGNKDLHWKCEISKFFRKLLVINLLHTVLPPVFDVWLLIVTSPAAPQKAWFLIRVKGVVNLAAPGIMTQS